MYKKGHKVLKETREKIAKAITIHGMYKTKVYRSWASMKERCLNKNHKRYKDYGGRGIIVCPEWLGENGFQNFYKDMGEKPENKTLDRINNSLGYCKSNCRWATRKEQNNNKRNNHLITYDNKTQTIAQWAEEFGINYKTLWKRIKEEKEIKKQIIKEL